MRSHHWVSLSLCFWKTYSVIYFHTLPCSSHQADYLRWNKDPIVSLMKCWMDSGFVSSPRLDPTPGLRHRLRSKWPTSNNTIWGNFSPGACAHPWRQLRCALCVLSGINWLQSWTDLETDTRHVRCCSHLMWGQWALTASHITSESGECLSGDITNKLDTLTARQ